MRALHVIMAFLLSLPVCSHLALANESPRLLSMTGPGNGTIENPLNLSVVATDPEGGNLTYTWYLDGESIGEGPNITYYLFPGARNVTLVISDPEGNMLTRCWTFSAAPPPGWGDSPNNARNRAMFWGIFGVSGAVLVLVLSYLLFRRK